MRQALIHLLLTENRPDEARVLGAEYLTGNGGFACMMRKKFDEYVAGNTAPLLEEVRPDHPGEHLDEAAREARGEEQEAEIAEYGCEVEDD